MKKKQQKNSSQSRIGRDDADDNETIGLVL